MCSFCMKWTVMIFSTKYLCCHFSDYFQYFLPLSKFRKYRSQEVPYRFWLRGEFILNSEKSIHKYSNRNVSVFQEKQSWIFDVIFSSIHPRDLEVIGIDRRTDGQQNDRIILSVLFLPFMIKRNRKNMISTDMYS